MTSRAAILLMSFASAALWINTMVNFDSAGRNEVLCIWLGPEEWGKSASTYTTAMNHSFASGKVS